MTDRNPQPDLISQAVAAELQRRKVSQLELARISGVLQPKISGWLNGKNDLRASNVAAILKALGLHVVKSRRGKTRASSSTDSTQTRGGESGETRTPKG